MQFHENFTASAKAMHVLHRVCFYLALWAFVIAGFVLAYTVYMGGAYFYAGADAKAIGAVLYAYAFYSLGLVVFAVIHLIAEILFRQIRDILVRRNAKVYVCDGCEPKCACGCEERHASDLDKQVDEIMKWKGLYVEGIITEREFIDKRNEILRLSK